MKLENRASVPVDITTAWKLVNDVAAIAPCMPGATVETLDGDDITGQVKVKLGPIAVTYRGVVTVIERDEAAHRIVMRARANETRGSGTAKATITAILTDAVGATEVALTTDLDITGKPAQFGRNIMGDVSARVIGQFVANLTAELESGRLGASTRVADGAWETADEVGKKADRALRSAEPELRTIGMRSETSDDAIDLWSAAGTPILKRLAPAAAGVAVLIVIRLWIRRRRS